MNRDKFVLLLRRMRCEWTLDQDGRIRTEIGEEQYCPLTAMLLRKVRRRLTICDYKEAAKLLGVHEKTGLLIVAASDGVEVISGLGKKGKKWRKDLLDATSLC